MQKLANLAFRREFAIIRAGLFLAPLVTLIAPKTTVPVLLVLFLICVGFAAARGAQLADLFRPDLTLTLLMVTAAYLLVNASWSLDPSRALGKAAWFALVAAMSVGACRALATWPKPQVHAAMTAFLAGLAAAAVLVLIEIVTNRFLTISVYNLLPFTRPESVKALKIIDGEVLRIAAHALNHTVAVMLLAMWPALLGLVTGFRGQARTVGAIVLFLFTCIAVFLSEHESSKAALVLSAIVFAAALSWPVWTRRALLAGWCLAFILVLPLTTLAYKAELHQSDRLEYSAKARVTLWAYTAEQIPNAPLLGIGATSTRKMDLDPEARLKAIEAKKRGEGFGWRAGAHAHNVFLQIWFELGAVGVALFMAVGIVIIGSVRHLPQSTQSYILALMTAFVTVLAFGWGMWQSWLMALAGLSGVYGALAVSFNRTAHSDVPTAGPP